MGPVASFPISTSSIPKIKIPTDLDLVFFLEIALTTFEFVLISEAHSFHFCSITTKHFIIITQKTRVVLTNQTFMLSRIAKFSFEMEEVSIWTCLFENVDIV